MAIVFISLALIAVAFGDPSVRTCEPIRVEMCKNMGYNVTGMPNLARHALQADADVTMQTFSPLIQYGCSSQLHLFLCSVYVPMCTDKVAFPIGPCRGLCESVHSRCFPILQGFGFPWPAELNCSLFPAENNHEHMCMEGPGEVPSLNLLPASTIPITLNPGLGGGNPACQKYSKSSNFVFLSRTNRCSQYCDADVLYDVAEKRLAEVWLSIWAALCFMCTLLAVLTFLAGAGSGEKRFAYPERPLIFMALCHNLTAVGWGVRGAAGRAAVACSFDAQSPARMLLSQDGLANPNCTVVFLLLYYFGMAATAWWAVLCGAWRAASLRRSAAASTPLASGGANGGAQRHSSLLQLAAWGAPAALATAVLVTRDVDADELTGTCTVGNQSSRSLLALVIIPHSAYIIIGFCFLISGFRLLLRSPRRPMQHLTLAPLTRKDQMPDIYLMRLGIFAVLYTVPVLCVLAGYIYEYYNKEDWLAAPQPSPVPVPPAKPAVWVFLLRIFMSQIMGVMTAVWIMSPKSLQVWKRLFQRLGPQAYKPAPVKCVAAPMPIHYYAPAPNSRTLPKRTHSHIKYSTYSHGSYRTPRSHHTHSLGLSGGETIL